MTDNKNNTPEVGMTFQNVTADELEEQINASDDIAPSQQPFDKALKEQFSETDIPEKDIRKALFDNDTPTSDDAPPSGFNDLPDLDIQAQVVFALFCRYF